MVSIHCYSHPGRQGGGYIHYYTQGGRVVVHIHYYTPREAGWCISLYIHPGRQGGVYLPICASQAPFVGGYASLYASSYPPWVCMYSMCTV